MGVIDDTILTVLLPDGKESQHIKSLWSRTLSAICSFLGDYKLTQRGCAHRMKLQTKQLYLLCRANAWLLPSTHYVLSEKARPRPPRTSLMK